MAPKSKKNIKNGFYYFMKELRELEESKGRKFSGLKEVSDFANPLWTVNIQFTYLLLSVIDIFTMVIVFGTFAYLKRVIIFL